MDPSPCTFSSSSSSRAFQRYQEHNLKHPSLFGESHTYKTKQNKLPSFIDRIFFPPTRFNPCTSSKGFGWFTFNDLIRWILLLQSSLFVLLWHLSTSIMHLCIYKFFINLCDFLQLCKYDVRIIWTKYIFEFFGNPRKNPK